MNNKNLVIVSDSTGETAIQIINAIKVHFDLKDVNILRYPDIVSEMEVDEVLEDLTGENLIYSTIIRKDIFLYLKNKCYEKKYILVDLFEVPISATEKFLNQKAKREVGLSRKLNVDYFDKIDALDFALAYDDGKDLRGIKLADIVLLGVSRTSKTPLSFNLAFKNYKVCNIPLLPEINPPKELFEIDPKKIIGLIINEDKLNEIRNKRLELMGIYSDSEYSSDSRITKELNFALDLYKRLGCTIIDVTSKTIEETTADIITIINKNKEK